jgi:hypothetical protein
MIRVTSGTGTLPEMTSYPPAASGVIHQPACILDRKECERGEQSKNESLRANRCGTVSGLPSRSSRNRSYEDPNSAGPGSARR